MNKDLCVFVGRTECLYPKLYDKGLYANIAAALTFEEMQSWVKEEWTKSRKVVEDYVREHSDEFEEVIVYGDHYERSNSFSVCARIRNPAGWESRDQVPFWHGCITCHYFHERDVKAALSKEDKE